MNKKKMENENHKMRQTPVFLLMLERNCQRRTFNRNHTTTKNSFISLQSKYNFRRRRRKRKQEKHTGKMVD